MMNLRDILAEVRRKALEERSSLKGMAHRGELIKLEEECRAQVEEVLYRLKRTLYDAASKGIIDYAHLLILAENSLDMDKFARAERLEETVVRSCREAINSDSYRLLWDILESEGLTPVVIMKMPSGDSIEHGTAYILAVQLPL